MTNAVYLASLVNSSGNNVTLQGGVVGSGTGIAFPATQVASSDANTLDDYEEGTWNPVLKNSGGTTVSYTSSFVGYTKIGNQITVATHLSLSATLASGVFTIEGLPFTSSNNVRGCGSCTFLVLGTGVYTPQSLNISNATTILSGYSSASLASGDRVNITITYFV